MDKVYVLGHKNPDTDSVCSAISYANLKRKLGFTNCEPVILGTINSETKFALDYFNVPQPEMMTSARTQISDIDFDRPVRISSECTIKEAWSLMTSNSTLLPITDTNKKLIGILSLSDIMKYNMMDFLPNGLENSDTTFANIRNTLNAGVVIGDDKLDEVVTGNVVICTNSSECQYSEGDIVIVNEGTNLKKVFSKNPKCIIGENNMKFSGVPKNFNGIVMSTPYSIFNIIRVINLALPVKNIIKTEDFLYFNENDTVESVREIVSNVRFRYFPILNNEKQVIGMLSRRHLINSKRKNIILVDHNEKSQSIDGLEEAKVLEIVDHHRVADVQTVAPIFFRNEPVGSTATIIASMYMENHIEIEPQIAGLLLSAILSDTFIFKSPTCTLADTQMAEVLAKKANIDLYDYGKKLLYNGTNMKSKTVESLVAEDFKEFTYDKYKIAISQIKVIELEQVDEIKEQLAKYIEELNANRGYDLTILMLTGIVENGTELLYVGNLSHIMPELFETSNPSTAKGTTGFLPNVISRKTQVAPIILNRIAQI